ncbi:uncharacterized protein V1518DRAFT_375874, partial [Limtongia smithiae]|uniref:uncharacterized protein n=1 Tax=Limtongia smithiae TaxID=1125753 RepID=UPI0034CDFAF1
MDSFADYNLESKEEFWEELDALVARQVLSMSLVEHAIKSFLRFVAMYMDDYLSSDEDLIHCCGKFLSSSVFLKHKAEVRHRLITTLVRKSPIATPFLLLIGLLLLLDGRTDVSTFVMMEDNEACGTIIDVLWHRREDDRRLRVCYLELLYEMCRVQRLQFSDLVAVPSDFIEYLFRCVEDNEDYENDPYNYAFIRILLVLNEQYMLLRNQSSSIAPSSTTPSPESEEAPSIAVAEPPSPPPVLENEVLAVLVRKGNVYKTFGTNIIILLNRERESCLQLLILKMLYNLFTTAETVDYFYLNDLRVLTDVFIRELNDLPDEADALRHTYLRVLYPLLSHTPLSQVHYKREELVRLLRVLVCYQPVSETTARLVARCTSVQWLSFTPSDKEDE